jgi:16S rRNA (uracil1498-N3)-methyltransferase
VATHRPPARVTLHRFFLPTECFHNDEVRFPKEQSRQIKSVLRMRPGDVLLALDGSGDECVVRLLEAGTVAYGKVEERRHNAAESTKKLVLYQGLLRGQKMEMVVQRCTEVGVSRIVPFSSNRSVSTDLHAARHQRLTTIAREAAEQSGRGRMPSVGGPLAYSDALRIAGESGEIVLFWEMETETRLHDLALEDPEDDRALSLFIGPEGGFSPAEVLQARARGARVVGVGPRILRAETAAIVGCTLLLARWKEIG